MKRRHKRYPKHDSFLFRIRTKKILLRALLITNLELKIILKNGNNNYRKIINNGRVCQVPINRENGASLYKLHARIANLLSSIETPEYLFSSSRGKGYIDNARFHLENCNKRMVKLDIKKFFPSVKFSHIINFFKKSMECSHDVSTILAKLIVFNDFLPTGSPLSDRVSYFAHQDMFDEINKKAGDLGCKMSLWVDDIVISGNKAQEASWEARKTIHNRGLEYHKKDKLKEYLPNNKGLHCLYKQ